LRFFLRLWGIFVKNLVFMENFRTIKLILDSMRDEVKDRETFLSKLKDLTTIKRKNVSEESISKEIISIDIFLERENYSYEEKEELLIIKNELQNIIEKK
jgi:hypothetical protein